MKVLLIQPPIRDFYQTRIRIQPIGAAYLAAVLMKNNFDVEILDCQAEGKKSSIPYPPEFSYLKKFYTQNLSPFSSFYHYYHFGLSFREIEEKIRSSGANLFGISALFTPYFGEVETIAQIIKKIDKNHIVITGGAHVSCAPEHVLQNPHIDYIVQCEGEERFLQLAACLREGNHEQLEKIDGIGYKSDSSLKINNVKKHIKNLDRLPFPARNMLPLDKYRINGQLSTAILTSRGCPYRCTFCSVSKVFGNKYRLRTPENVIQEMNECIIKHNITSFDFLDDNLTFDPDRTEQLMDLIIDHFGESRLHLTAMNGITAVNLNRRILEKMKRAGFDTLNISLVSTSGQVQKSLKRPVSNISFSDTVKHANELNYNITAYQILGLPSETIDRMIETIHSMMKENILLGPSIFYPTPGTELFATVKDTELFQPENYKLFRSTCIPFENEFFSRKDIVTLFYIVRAINFIKSLIDDLPENIEPETNEMSMRDLLKAYEITIKIPEIKNKPANEFNLTIPDPLPRKEAGIILLNILYNHLALYGIKKIKKSKTGYTYLIYKLNYSENLLKAFFEKENLIVTGVKRKMSVNL